MSTIEHLAHAKRLDDGTCAACVITLDGIGPIVGTTLEEAMINLRIALVSRLGVKQEDLEIKLIGTVLTPTSARLAEASDRMTVAIEEVDQLAVKNRELSVALGQTNSA